MDESRLPTLYDPAADTLVPFADTTFRVARAPLLAVAPHLAARIVPGFSLSPLFSPQPNETSSGSQPSPSTHSGSILKIDDLVSSHDFAALVAHLVYDAPATVAVLRASTSSALDIPSLRTTALAALADRFPSPLARLDEDDGKLDVDDDGGRGRAESGEELEEALEIAMFSTNEVSPETKKTLLYRVATSTDFDPTGAHDPSLPTSTALSTSPPTAPDPTPILAAAHPALSPRTLRVCHRVLASLIAHFTPVLFTVGNAQHMACTDVLAARWMGDVIGPALADGGVGHPIETLARMRVVVSRSWVPLGICTECERWLKAEYVGEGRAVWEKLDGWIEDAEKAEDAAGVGSLGDNFA